MARPNLMSAAVFLVLYTAALVFNLLFVAGVLSPGKEAPADEAGYWKALNWLAVMLCLVVDAYLVSIFVSSRRLSRAMAAGLLPPPPPQMDMC